MLAAGGGGGAGDELGTGVLSTAGAPGDGIPLGRTVGSAIPGRTVGSGCGVGRPIVAPGGGVGSPS